MPRPKPASTGSGRPSRRGFGRDVAVTGCSQLVVAVGGLILYRQLAAEKGLDGFADYALIKQAVLLFVPVALLGLGPALPRAIASRNADRGEPEAEVYLVGSLAATVLTSGAVVLLALAAPAVTASLLFGASDRQSLVAPFAATLASTVLFRVTYGYFRGRGHFLLGSAVESVGIAAAPVVIVAAQPGAPIERLVLAMAAILAVLAAAAVLPAVLRGIQGRVRGFRSATVSLLRYGCRRVPGDIAYVVLFASAPGLIARVGSQRDVAYFSAGQQIIALLTIAGLPIGLVALPRLAALWNTDRRAARRVMIRIVQSAALAGVFITVQLVAFGDVAARAWLGADFAGSGTIVRTVTASSGLYLLYILLRSPIDAVAERAHNTRNTLAGVAVFGLVSGSGMAFGAGPGAITVGFSAGLATLGVLSVATARRLFGIPFRDLQLGSCLVAIVPVAAIVFVVREQMDIATAGTTTLLEIGVLEPALLALYVLALHLVGARVPGSPLRRRRGPFDAGSSEAEPESEEE
jgi:O-antigen/teichoic acid export membrane protein